MSTEFGSVRVAIQGNTKKPAIVTYHDIGLNRKFCWRFESMIYIHMLKQ